MAKENRLIIPANATREQQIEAIRSRRAALLAEALEAESGPVTRDEILERVRAMIARDAASYRENHLRPAINELSRPGAPQVVSLVPTRPAELAWLVAAFHGDVMLKAIEHELATMTLPNARPAAGRADAVERVNAEILGLEVEEERLIREAEISREPIDRRADADGAILLGLVEGVG